MKLFGAVGFGLAISISLGLVLEKVRFVSETVRRTGYRLCSTWVIGLRLFIVRRSK